MADNLYDLALNHSGFRMLVMLHNLHIKRCGSQEKQSLRLKSVREHFESLFPEQCYSVAQLAGRGVALNNDLSLFNFNINDPLAIESHYNKEECFLLIQSLTPDSEVAFHHAFERETVPVKKIMKDVLSSKTCIPHH